METSKVATIVGVCICRNVLRVNIAILTLRNTVVHDIVCVVEASTLGNGCVSTLLHIERTAEHLRPNVCSRSSSTIADGVTVPLWRAKTGGRNNVARSVCVAASNEITNSNVTSLGSDASPERALGLRLSCLHHFEVCNG